jgi:hypothetical protein
MNWMLTTMQSAGLKNAGATSHTDRGTSWAPDLMWTIQKEAVYVEDESLS